MVYFNAVYCLDFMKWCYWKILCGLDCEYCWMSCSGEIMECHTGIEFRGIKIGWEANQFDYKYFVHFEWFDHLIWMPQYGLIENFIHDRWVVTYAQNMEWNSRQANCKWRWRSQNYYILPCNAGQRTATQSNPIYIQYNMRIRKW